MNSMLVCSSCTEEQGFPAPCSGRQPFPEIPRLDAHCHTHMSLLAIFKPVYFFAAGLSAAAPSAPGAGCSQALHFPGTGLTSRAALWGSLRSQLFPGVLEHSWGASHGKGKKKRNLFSLGKVAGGQPETGILFLDHLCPGSPVHCVTGWKLFYQSQNSLYEHLVCSWALAAPASPCQ